MNKIEVLKKFIETIEAELKVLKKSAQDTADYATDSENKPENKYDTRGLEASYLAGAQAKRVAEMQDVLVAFHHQLKISNDQKMKIAVGSLVEVSIDEKSSLLLVMLLGGGQSIHHKNETIQVVTTSSPIGKVMIGKEIGDTFSITTGAREKEYEIISIY